MSQAVTVQNLSFKVGHTMTITGVPTNDSTGFSINVGQSAEDLSLHVNPRFDCYGDKRRVVLNSYKNGSWGQEHREGGFPFNQDKVFQVMIIFTTGEFTITLQDGFKMSFPNRACARKFGYFQFRGDVRIHGIEIK